MITELFLDLLGFMFFPLVGMLNALIPSPPGWSVTVVDGWHTVWGFVESFDTWLPITFGLGCFAAVVVTYFAGLVIGTIRVLTSYATFGGNS